MTRVTAPGPEPKRCGMWRTRNCSPDSVNAAAPIRVAGTTTATSTSRQAAESMRRRRTTARFPRFLQLRREVDVQSRAGAGRVDGLGHVDAERQHRGAEADADTGGVEEFRAEVIEGIAVVDEGREPQIPRQLAHRLDRAGDQVLAADLDVARDVRALALGNHQRRLTSLEDADGPFQRPEGAHRVGR